MTRLNVWSPSNRVLEEKLHESRREAHLARLESIHNAQSRSVAKPSSSSPQRITPHQSFRAMPRSKSPAAKSRQAEIERENLKLIKKLVELQQGSGTTKNTGFSGTRRRSRPASASANRPPQKAAYVPQHLRGLTPSGGLGVPTAASHPLYTRHSATMTHHFEEQNDIPLNFVPGMHSTAASRHRTQVQILDENRKMLHRILSSKTTFSRASWQADEAERRKLLSNISRFSHLNNRRSSASGAMTPVASPIAGSRLVQDSHRTIPTSSSRQRNSQHTLVVVDHLDGQRWDLSSGVRTGSPVSHLRHRPRPQSASATAARHRDVRFDSDLSGSEHVGVTDAMEQLGIGDDYEHSDDDCDD